MSKAGRRTKRFKRHTAQPKSTLTVVDLIYRRLTGDATGKAPIGKGCNDLRRSR